MRKVLTLCLAIQDGRLLLGMKKRGFGARWWNGFGGKIEEGEPIETEEMRPQWFVFAEIPYDTMWPDDRYWIPLFLAGKKFRTKFLFGAGDVILEKEILEVENLTMDG